jgi:hypothetical protein
MVEALQAIAEGYPMRVEQDRYIVVENPSFAPDNGAAPSLVIDTHALATLPSSSEAQRDKVSTLFAAIQHGDKDHRAWLKEAIDAHFAGNPVPAPRGSGRKEQRIAELEAALTLRYARGVEDAAKVAEEYAAGCLQARGNAGAANDRHAVWQAEAERLASLSIASIIRALTPPPSDDHCGNVDADPHAAGVSVSIGREIDKRVDGLMAAILPIYEAQEASPDDIRALCEAVDALDSDAIEAATPPHAEGIEGCYSNFRDPPHAAGEDAVERVRNLRFVTFARHVAKNTHQAQDHFVCTLYVPHVREFITALDAFAALPAHDTSGEVERRYVLEWDAAPRPPAHPKTMRGNQSFRAEAQARAFMAQRPADARFVSLTEVTTSLRALAASPASPREEEGK